MGLSTAVRDWKLALEALMAGRKVGSFEGGMQSLGAELETQSMGLSCVANAQVP